MSSTQEKNDLEQASHSTNERPDYHIISRFFIPSEFNLTSTLELLLSYQTVLQADINLARLFEFPLASDHKAAGLASLFTSTEPCVLGIEEISDASISWADVVRSPLYDAELQGNGTYHVRIQKGNALLELSKVDHDFIGTKIPRQLVDPHSYLSDLVSEITATQSTFEHITSWQEIIVQLSIAAKDLLANLTERVEILKEKHSALEAHTGNQKDAGVKIWGHDTYGYIYSDEINAAFSSFLDYPVALVYKGPEPRVVQGNGSPDRVGRVQTINFPDEFPVLIASDAPLKELNTRLISNGVDPITIERFRPNIIVRGEKPWIEDLWKLVRIKATPSKDWCDDAPQEVEQEPLFMDIVTRCGRCQVPNVDPDSAVKHKKQPWDTLVSYRRVDAGLKYKPCFGMMGMPRKEGVVEVGMRFEVLEETTEHRYIM
ncbi:hypothetical protein N7478_001469 [Penicillium angulare]|uniref:uncharacterized protein n=1 Tax=Penicillium angulare TaxID=116970 RepID=UPI0025403341|nr:uncharacterized protein N7478_001469 [Penicillium angulare]KAJ5292218.1 hypothetical protein N7478_001469 [Penicillium angulare]